MAAPRLFALALTEGAHRPLEVASVGDSLTHDVASAVALGIRPVVRDRHSRHGPIPGCAHIATLAALPAVLRT